MLIRSCVFHYEFELIHPLADGNGLVGQLWHTLLLSKWNPAFAWLPVESMIHSHQQEYYEAINASNDAGESTRFIEFVLTTIKASLIATTTMSYEISGGKSNKSAARWGLIEQFCGRTPHHERRCAQAVRCLRYDLESHTRGFGARGAACEASRGRALSVFNLS